MSKYNEKFIFKASLALEGYVDINGEIEEELQDIYECHNNFSQHKKKYTEDEVKKYTLELVNKYNKIFDTIGRNNFIFYDDGDVEYILEVKNVKR